jgi:1,2-diacylglycerol 3-alpha-glucosyltransferase
VTIAICFGQFGPYHHARVVALQLLVQDQKTKRRKDQETRVVPVQIAAATATYGWSGEHGAGLPARSTYRSERSMEQRDEPDGVASPPKAKDLRTLCAGIEEAASPVEVFRKARRLFREEKVDVAFLPSYSPARYFALFAAAKSLGLRTVMMNESHAGTEQATGWKRWIKRQIVKRFDAALVGGEPHKRHFASLGIPAEKIFTGYDAVDNALFAAKADEVRSMPSGS